MEKDFYFFILIFSSFLSLSLSLKFSHSRLYIQNVTFFESKILILLFARLLKSSSLQNLTFSNKEPYAVLVQRRKDKKKGRKERKKKKRRAKRGYVSIKF